MPSSERRRLLVLAPGALGDRLSGPEIRSVRLARALAAEHEVTLIAPGAVVTECDGMPVVPFSRRALVREARRNDALMAAVVPPFALLLKRRLGIAAISDQYDPVELELGTLAAGAVRARATARAARRLQLRCADAVLCAGRSQRELLEAELDQIDGSRPPLRTVPFGIDADPPPAAGAHLRERFPRIGAEDRIVLWWGSLWRWLDAETAIRAFARISESRPDVKLVFTAGRPPNGGVERHSVVGEARDLAQRLGLLDRTVFFFDEWIPYARRAEYLREADLGLTLHRDTEEAPLAARARYMDYLWAGLPCVLGRGDETADRFAAGGFARLVGAGSPDEAAAALLGMLEPDALEAARAAAGAIAEELRWQQVAAPLLETVAELGRGRAGRDSASQIWPTTSYYVRRLIDRAVPSA